MKNTQKWLMPTIAIALIVSSCEPRVIKDDTAKLLAACGGQPRWVGEKLYDYVLDVYEKKLYDDNNDELGDIVFEEGDDMWNLEVLKETEDDYGDNITENDLYEFIHNGIRPESNVTYSTAFANAFFGAAFGKSGKMKSKTLAFKTANEICEGDFAPLVKSICKSVTIYDYRKNEFLSSKKVTVYDVVYKINGKSYVLCTVHNLGDGAFEVNYVNSSDYFSKLGF